MARKLTNGTVPAIGATFGTTTAITGTTNENPAVATFAAGHGLVTGEYVEIVSHDWPQPLEAVCKRWSSGRRRALGRARTVSRLRRMR